MSETHDQHEYVTQFAVFVLQHPLLVQRDFYHQKKKKNHFTISKLFYHLYYTVGSNNLWP